MIILFPLRPRLDVIGIVKHDAAFLERANVVFVGMLVERQQHVRLVPALNTSPEPMRTWKIEGPPEIVAGMVINVMTSCSLRPASRARKPPITWMPSCELPAMRMTASLIRETFGAPFGDAPVIVSFMKPKI